MISLTAQQCKALNTKRSYFVKPIMLKDISHKIDFSTTAPSLSRIELQNSNIQKQSVVLCTMFQLMLRLLDELHVVAWMVNHCAKSAQQFNVSRIVEPIELFLSCLFFSYRIWTQGCLKQLVGLRLTVSVNIITASLVSRRSIPAAEEGSCSGCKAPGARPEIYWPGLMSERPVTANKWLVIGGCRKWVGSNNTWSFLLFICSLAPCQEF